MAQVGRMFEGAKQRNEDNWKRTRLIAWEVNKQYHKHPPDIDQYLRIGEVEDTTKATQEELDEIWRKYDNKKKKKNGRTRAKSKDNSGRQ